ncbi:MAG: sulfurtransferase complex subunit TusB [Gammaproteobacteria bacterium]|nr:sulfurtransferase complex subunit TusB [Gammaproteobacteria bacterium]MBU1647245.1 sulfurtransferase complex subunit TusB [Gammaproteobacteria bacterium]MBU1972757.1 sulfurtransferase complex subunit TusB [Gammaproteobacteria bacterium]
MLHIVNKSPLDRNSLDAVLGTGDGGAILLIEDGVYAATKGNAYEPKLKAAMAKFKIYALQGDLEARGISDRVTDGVAAVDYAGFVDLVADNKTNQSWL